MNIFRYLVCSTLVLLVVGCGSTPQRDDYAKHVNRLKHSDASVNYADMPFAFANPDIIDLRGEYSNDTSTTGTPILYDGSAGLLGVFVQAGIHASMTSSARQTQLAEQQEKANERIQPLSEKLVGVAATDLVIGHKSRLAEEKGESNDIIMLRPIFFSNAEMSELSLKLVAWIPGKSAKKPRYQNMVHIYSASFADDSGPLFVDMQPDAVKHHMSRLLDSAIGVISSDISGRYASQSAPAKTFIVNHASKQKVIRGKLMETTCDFQVVKNLRDWFVLLPKDVDESSEVETCQQS